MYSLVLMTALSSAPDTPEFNGFFRSWFGHGCNGCYGSCYGSCYGCNGCYGHAFLGLRDRSWFFNGGCCGGCYGGTYSYGCSGATYAYGCAGASYSCSGMPVYSCSGGPVYAYNPQFSAGLSCVGGPVPYAPAPDFGPTLPSVPAPAGIPYATPDPAPPGTISDSSRASRPTNTNGITTASASVPSDAARATVIVRLPADAKLYAEESLLRLTGAERRFVSPPLPAGQDFTYRFRVEYDRDGETVSVTKKVTVRAGASANVEFTDLTAAKRPADSGPVNPPATPTSNPATGTTPISTVSNPNPGPAPATRPTASATPQTDRARFTVKLPPGASLYVDNRKDSSAAPVRQFSSPPLPTGKEFAYEMKAEIIRNGRPEYMIQKVHFRAGDQLTVDLTDLGK